MKLRPYELKAVRELPGVLKKHRRVVAVAPTGAGKTVIAAALVMTLRGKRVLWLAHRIELLRQALEQLVAAGIPASRLGLLAGVGSVQLRDDTSIGQNGEAAVLVASVDMFRGGREVPPCDLIVVDEAHRVMAKTYRDILDARPKAMVLGLTATPWRLDGEPLGDVFEHLLVMAEAVELIADKFIAAPLVYGVPEAKARAIVKGLKTNGGDFRLKDAERSAMRYLMGDVVRERERLARGERTLVFATTRKHGKALAKRFKRSGVKTEYLDAETSSEERSAMLARLESGETEIIVNVDVLVEGFDCPSVKCIVLARPTRSLTRFLQQCGRASRPFGNKRPIILDHAGNCWRFGLPTSPREWSLDGRGKGESTGKAPVKECPECERVIPFACQVCPECGAEQPLAEREIEEQRARLEVMRVTEEERAAALERIRAVAKERNIGEWWCEDVLARLFARVA